MKYEKVLNEILSADYLIKYGYYSIKKTRVVDIEDEYTSQESLYKIFNLEIFSALVNQLMPLNNEVIETEPIYFSIPKKDLVRRQLKFPNLYSYVQLVSYMEDNKFEFVNEFLINKFSSSKYFDSPHYKFEVTEKQKNKLLLAGNKVLHLDFSNFFHTLYTHSIPWMIMGKKVAKIDRKSGFANKLDRLIVCCQNGETHGIPTGNLASRIIAELFMCHFDKILANEGFKYSRYVDDISFAYTHDLQKEKFIEKINLLCREYNLYLNSEKTKIEEFPQNKTRNKVIIFNYFDNVQLNKLTLKKQVQVLFDFIEICIDEESKGNKGALKLIFSGIERNLYNNNNLTKEMKTNILLHSDDLSNLSVFEVLLDLSLKKSELANRFIDLCENIFSDCLSRKKAKKVIENYFNDNTEIIIQNLEFYVQNKFNQEMYQILLYIVLFDIKTSSLLKKNILRKFLKEDIDDFSQCLLTIIYLKKGLKLEDLLTDINEILEKSSQKITNQSRFSRQNWFFRYFIYFLIYEDIIPRKEVNKFLNTNKVKLKNGCFQSELDAEYILKQGNQRNINDFYKNMLDNHVPILDCGIDNKFIYF